jgi:hypothetical protein
VAQGARLVYAPDAVVRHPTLDDRRSFLAKVRSTNRWRAVRRARDGERPSLSGVLAPIPIVGVAVARREALRPILKLEPSRLGATGLRAGWFLHARAIWLLYSVVAYVAGFAQLRGWLEGFRRYREPVGIA